MLLDTLTPPTIVYHGHKQEGKVADPDRGGVAFAAYPTSDGLYECSHCHARITADDPSVWAISDGRNTVWREVA